MLPVLPLFANQFDVPYFWIGLVLAGEGLGLLISDLPAGILLHRLDQKRAMLLGITIIGLSTLGLFFAQTIVVVIGLRLLAGVGASVYHVARHTYIADTIQIANRGRSVALLGGTFRLGRFAGPVIGGWVAANSDLRAPFVLYFLVCMLSLAAIVAFNRERRTGQPAALEQAGQPARPPLTFASIRHSFKSNLRILTFPGIGHLLMQMVRVGPSVVIPLYASNVLGLDVQTIGLIFGASSAVDMTLFYPTGMIMDRFGRKFSVVPSAFIMGLALAVIPFTQDLTGLYLAAILNGFGNGLGSGVMLTIGADLAPRGARGEFLGLWNLIGDAGTTGGPLVVGGVADILALQPAIWVMAGVGFAASAVFAFFVPETLEKKTKKAPA